MNSECSSINLKVHARAKFNYPVREKNVPQLERNFFPIREKKMGFPWESNFFLVGE